MQQTKSLPLQYVRAVAAVSVALYHASFYLLQYRGYSAFSDVFVSSFGELGVLTFFALSGLLMSSQARKLHDHPARFLAHRIIRIFPIFWLACTIHLIVSYSFGTGGQFNPLTLTLAPLESSDYVLGVEWTLVYEVAFYIYVFIIILLGVAKWIEHIATLWLLFIALFALVHPGFSPQFPDLLRLPLSATCAPFAFGMVIPALIRKRLINHSYLAAGPLLVVLAKLPFFDGYSIIFTGIGCAVVVAWAAALPSEEAMQSALLERIGEWSFAIYLIHVPTLTLFYLILPARLGAAWAWCVAFSAALVAGSLLGAIDTFTYRHLKTYIDSVSPRSIRIVPAAFLALFGLSIFFSYLVLPPSTHPILTIESGEPERSATDIQSILAKASIRPTDDITGYIDSVVKSGDELVVTGWVNDRTRFGNGARVILIGEHGFDHILVPVNYRLDVIGAHGLKGYLFPVAFRQHVPLNACPPGSIVQAVGINMANKTYRLLNVARCP